MITRTAARAVSVLAWPLTTLVLSLGLEERDAGVVDVVAAGVVEMNVVVGFEDVSGVDSGNVLVVRVEGDSSVDNVVLTGCFADVVKDELDDEVAAGKELAALDGIVIISGKKSTDEVRSTSSEVEVVGDNVRASVLLVT